VRGIARRAGGVGPRRAAALALALAGCALLASGCGGGTRQDAHEAPGTFELKVLRASFPARQAVARPTKLELRVSNTGSRTVPDVAVTLDSLAYIEHFPELAANKRPIWAIERGPGAIANPPVESQEVSPPGGGQTAYVNTWALGPLAPGATQSFVWSVVPVKPGAHTVVFTVAAGLAGRATAVADLRTGAPVRGSFAVTVAPAPATTHVDPNTGRVAIGAYPATP
jgi:hypothetical protein